MNNTTDQKNLIDIPIGEAFGIATAANATIKGMPAGHPYAPKRKDYVFQRDVFRDMMAFWLSDERALKIQGDPATGKTSLVEQFHARLNMPLMIVSCNQSMEAYQLYGQLIPNEDGKLRWQDGPVVKAARNGWSVLLDEYNTLDPNVATSLNALLEGYSVTIPETGEVISPHANFRVFATENPVTSQLVVTGRNVMDVANADRWMVIEVDYLPKDIETGVVERHIAETNKDVKQAGLVATILVETATQIRAAFRDGKGLIDKPISLRTLIRWARLLRMYRAVDGRPVAGTISGATMAAALSRSFSCSSKEMQAEVARKLTGVIGSDV